MTNRPANETPWEHFHHEADIGVRGYGRTVEEAFENAALALTSVMTDLSLVDPQTEVAIECSSPDVEVLFVDWLNAIVYEMDTRRMLFSRFSVSLNGELLHAKAWGETIDVPKHKPAVEVKGATFTELKVATDDDDRWLAQCVVDV